MPTIFEDGGVREASAAELRLLYADADRKFRAFWEALEWQPIEAYDRSAMSSVVLAGDGADWVFGYFGPDEWWHDELDTSLRWREAGEGRLGQPIAFEPRRFATVNDEWHSHLSAD